MSSKESLLVFCNPDFRSDVFMLSLYINFFNVFTVNQTKKQSARITPPVLRKECHQSLIQKNVSANGGTLIE